MSRLAFRADSPSPYPLSRQGRGDCFAVARVTQRSPLEKESQGRPSLASLAGKNRFRGGLARVAIHAAALGGEDLREGV